MVGKFCEIAQFTRAKPGSSLVHYIYALVCLKLQRVVSLGFSQRFKAMVLKYFMVKFFAFTHTRRTHTAQVHLKVLQFLTWNMIVFRILGFDSICYAKGYFEFGLRSCMHLSTATSGHQQKYIQLLKLCAFSFVAACAFEKLWLLSKQDF